MNELLDLLDWLEENKIYYRLNKVNENILVEIAIPGERWEIEVQRSGILQVERFVSSGEIAGELALDDIFSMLSDRSGWLND